MSEKEHTRTSFGLALGGGVHHYSNTKILLLAGVINRSSKNNDCGCGNYTTAHRIFCRSEKNNHVIRNIFDQTFMILLML
jgi:hypothetical protein